MLIDDEEAIRNMLKIAIPWDEYSMEIVGEADSGSEAINCIDQLMPDLIFVDIRMPFMNGIEFSKIVAKRYPRIKILILTAYADFTYARECIEISNVLGYLLKPMNVKEIKGYLKQCQCEISETQKNFSEQQSKNFSEKNLSGENDLIKKIQKYICDNYGNCYLNVGAVAEQFGYNANYLSSMYKKATGTLLSDQIFRVRMERAKVLKKQGMKMYLVAKEVGIEDPFYFSKCFRKYTGMKFSDYEEEKE